MKFIHAADIHLDSSSTKIKKLYGQKEVSVIGATHRAFIALIDYVLEEDVDFVVFSGDLFDANWRDYSIGLFFIEQIKRLSCPIYYIRGNHDSENRLFKSLPFPKNLTIFKSGSAETVLDDNLKVAIHGQSYSHFHTKDDLAALYPEAVPGYFNIGLLHTSGEKQNGELPYAPYEKKELLKKEYDYWALGHIHSAKIVSEKPHIVYSGVIQGRHIRETGQKGCYLVQVNNQEVQSLKFKVLGDVIWETVSLNTSKMLKEDSLKELLIETIEPLLAGQSKNVRFIIRLLFVGDCSIEKPIYQHQEYYRNAIYCWLNDRFEHEIYLEKLVDKTLKVSAQDKDQTEILNYIYKNLEASENEIGQLIEDETKALLAKIPGNVLNEISDEGIAAEREGSLTRIKQYLELKLSGENK